MLLVDDVKCEGFLGECRVEVRKNTGNSWCTKCLTTQVSGHNGYVCERSVEVQ
jgi:hypothetical protein